MESSQNISFYIRMIAYVNGMDPRVLAGSSYSTFVKANIIFYSLISPLLISWFSGWEVATAFHIRWFAPFMSIILTLTVLTLEHASIVGGVSTKAGRKAFLIRQGILVCTSCILTCVTLVGSFANEITIERTKLTNNKKEEVIEELGSNKLDTEYYRDRDLLTAKADTERKTIKELEVLMDAEVAGIKASLTLSGQTIASSGIEGKGSVWSNIDSNIQLAKTRLTLLEEQIQNVDANYKAKRIDMDNKVASGIAYIEAGTISFMDDIMLCISLMRDGKVNMIVVALIAFFAFALFDSIPSLLRIIWRKTEGEMVIEYHENITATLQKLKFENEKEVINNINKDDYTAASIIYKRVDNFRTLLDSKKAELEAFYTSPDKSDDTNKEYSSNSSTENTKKS